MTALAQPIATTTAQAPKIRKYKPDALLYVTAAFMLMNVWRFQELMPILGKLKISLVLEILLLGLVLTQTSRVRSWKWVKSKIFAAPLLLVALMWLSLPLNLYRGQGLIFLTKDYGPTLLMFVSLSLGIRERDDLDFIAFVHVSGAAVYSLWVLKFIQIGADGRLGDLYYYDANDYGLLLVCAIPLAIYFVRPGVPIAKRLFALGALALFTLMLTRTGSRGGFLGFAAVMAIIIWKYRAVPKRIRFGAVVGGVLLLVAFGSTRYWDMMQSILHPNEDYNTTSAVGRKAIWKRGIGYMLSRPAFGVGAGAFGVAEGRLSETSKEFAERGGGFKWSTAHNSFVLAAAEEGIPGILLFVSMLWLLIRQLLRVIPAPRGSPFVFPSDAAFSQALTVSVIGFCVSGSFVSATYSPGLYVLAGLGVAQLAILRRRAALGINAAPALPPSASLRRSGLARRTLKPTWTPAA